MNWEIFTIALTGLATIAALISVYFGLKAQYREIKADVGAANGRIDATNLRLDATNARLDATWQELLTITRHFKITQETK